MTLENTRSEQPGLPTVAELRAALAASQAEVSALKRELATAHEAADYVNTERFNDHREHQAEVSRLTGELAEAKREHFKLSSELLGAIAGKSLMCGERDTAAASLERARLALDEARPLVRKLLDNTRHAASCCCLTCDWARDFLYPPVAPAPPTPIATPGTDTRSLCGCTKWWDEPPIDDDLARITPATRCPDCRHPGPHCKPCDYYATPGTPTEEET